MKIVKCLIILLAAAWLAAAVLPAFAQAERVKGKAKDLKRQVENTNSFKTNLPPKKPIKA